ncbi:MAG: HAMP domain-containing protein, partial [Chloroflexota bacterium]
MIFRSIRWRLTLSFAGIALLAAFVLGAALLAILEDYYARMEFEYLWSNAQAISAMLTKIMATDLPKDVVQLQIENFSFLSQTRVRVLDENGQTLYESNIPQKTDVAVGVTRQRILIEGNVGDKPTNEFMRIITVGDVFTETLGAPGTLPPKDHVFFSYRLTSAVGTPFGFELGTGMSAADARSIRKARVALVDSTGKKQGAVELTEGPALGRAIVNSVLRGWIVASVIAVVLAAIAGWFISRRISAPVLALTNTTTRMANGDLSSRADISSRDEFGALARAFNAMADEIETTVNALRRFAADAAHELNTPLTALRADLDLALTETQPRAL